MKLEPMIYTADITSSINFYTETLGLEISEYYPNRENPTWVALKIGDQRLAIGMTFKDINHKYHSKGIIGSGVHFYIVVDNIDEVYNKLKSKINIIDEIENKPWGSREFALKDPDGYLLSFSDSV
ncbi:MAG: VOC family protein [Candidatus Kariarchaeaceae archaeon]|jgi:uncharacterized glyoxalase superfamily protein PhnB